ncbi:MAG: site-2 protease family protein [Phycisphaerae bacterium]
MHGSLNGFSSLLAQSSLTDLLLGSWYLFVALLMLTAIVFFHELGHFLAAKWMGVRVDRFAVGFGKRLFGYRAGEGFTLGGRPNYTNAQLAARGYGETDYCLNLLPLGGYVKMMGEDDFIEDEKTGELRIGDDPRAYPNRPVGARMIVVSAGVIFNILFAALLLMAVYLFGRPVLAPVVGPVAAQSSAYGKLLPGDRILEMDGTPTRTFLDILTGGVFSDGIVDVKLQRGGATQTIKLDVPKHPRENLRLIEVLPQITTKRTIDGYAVAGKENLLAGDTIRAVDGVAVNTSEQVLAVFQRSGGRVLELEVERPSKNKGEPAKTVTVYQRAQINLAPASLAGDRRGHVFDDSNLLGFKPRRAVGNVEPGQPAQRSGFLRGDVIVEWGGLLNPTYEELVDVITDNPGKPIDAKVLRVDQVVALTVTPTNPINIVGGEPQRPMVGLRFDGRWEDDQPIVSDIATATPAATIQMPRGSRIVSFDGKPTANWIDVVNAALAAAGRSVEVRYRAGDQEVATTLVVPSSMVNELMLPPGTMIWAVDGKKEVELASAAGAKKTYSVANNSAVIREYLQTRLGETVKLTWSPGLFEAPRETEFAVRADNVDPWQLRMDFTFDFASFEPLFETLSANGNPLLAMQMGGEFIVGIIRQSYLSMLRIATRDMGVQNMSGPIGIARAGMQVASAGFVDIFIFMAMLSVGLAVMNFLPLPVMDGGQMVFLLIEKVRGKPLNFKVHIITTLVGLAAILIVFVFVTVQDIGKLLSGS